MSPKKLLTYPKNFYTKKRCWALVVSFMSPDHEDETFRRSLTCVG